MMNGTSHNAAEKPVAKGPLSPEDLNANGFAAANEIFNKFTTVSGAKMTWGDWMALRGVIAAHVSAQLHGLQMHLLGCSSLWAAMLAPEDQPVLLEALKIVIDDTHVSSDEQADFIAKVEVVRAKVATTAPAENA
jgi:hypothetical protein